MGQRPGKEVVMTQKYIGVKQQVEAWPEDKNGNPGYRVKYPDGYISWSPKNVFESAYLPMGEDNDGSKITEQMVTDFIVIRTVHKIGDKTTVVQVTLQNRFLITEASSCVDPANYDEDIGVKICVDRIKTKVFELLGFLLQTARYGITGLNTPDEANDEGSAGQQETE